MLLKSYRHRPHVTTVISQGSVATRLWCGGSVTVSLLQISWRIQQWKNCENPSTSAKVMGKSIEVLFLTHSVESKAECLTDRL